MSLPKPQRRAKTSTASLVCWGNVWRVTFAQSWPLRRFLLLRESQGGRYIDSGHQPGLKSFVVLGHRLPLGWKQPSPDEPCDGQQSGIVNGPFVVDG